MDVGCVLDKHPKKSGFLAGGIFVIRKIRKSCYVILDVLMEEGGHYIKFISSPEWNQTMRKAVNK